MKRTTVLILMVLALAFTGVGLAEQQGRDRGPEFSTRVETLPWYTPAEPMNVRFTLENGSAEALWVLRWQLPSDDIDANIFTVTCNGKPVTYTGPLVKRAAPTAEDYVLIGPGESVTTLFDPSAVYDMTSQGQYTIQYRVQGLYARKEAPDAGQPSFPAERARVMAAQPAGFWFEGIEKPQTPPQAYEPSLMGIGGYTKCTTSQQNTLVTAHNNAKSIASKAQSHLAANPNGSSLYTYWFGTYSSSRFNTVKSHYASVYDAFANKSVTYNCSCKQNYYAYVYPTKPYTIYLCKVFWQAPALGRDSKAGTLVHEMTHFNVTCGTDDYVYGATGAHNLAVSDPAKAVDNADNHEYFAEDQP